MTTIAIMQPYFAPYAGYFRLIHAADIFVVYDCVQFPRRGWVHRNKLSSYNGTPKWATLPVKKQGRNTRIRDLEFSEHAQSLWNKRLRQFQHLNTDSELWTAFSTLTGTPLQFIVNVLQTTCKQLNLNTRWLYSSDLNIPETVKAQDRIIQIVRKLSGTRYINLSGGIELYNAQTFDQQNIQLDFLTEYSGNFTSIFERLLTEDHSTITSEILANCTYQQID